MPVFSTVSSPPMDSQPPGVRGRHPRPAAVGNSGCATGGMRSLLQTANTET